MKKTIRQLVLAISICFLLPQPSPGATGVGNDNPTGVTGDYNGSITTGGSYDPYTGNAKRFVTDLTVTGSLGAYPLKWTRIHNTRGSGTWRNSYQWTLWLRPFRGYNYYPNLYEGPDGLLSYPDGRTKVLTVEPDNTFWEDTAAEPADLLVPVDQIGNYDLILADGGRVQFRHNAPQMPTSTYSLTVRKIVDPHGLETTIERDHLNRLWKIREPGGRYLEITYQNYSYWVPWPYPGGNVFVQVISKVEAFARPGEPVEKVIYHYGEPEIVGYIRFYYLRGVDYDDGTHATYTHFPAFAHPEYPTSVLAGPLRTCDDPRFEGAMGKIEYVYHSGQGSVVGQIKGEKYPGASSYVSEIIYPPYVAGAIDRWRKEKRPDGRERTFYYNNDWRAPELESYTDFKGQPYIVTWPAGTAGGYKKILTDPRGKTTSVEKEHLAGAVLEATRGNGPPLKHTYSDANNPYYLASKTDERGKITYYDRNNEKRIWQTRYPDGGYETFTYNHFGQVLEHRLTSGGTEIFEYDERGLKTSYTPPATLSDPNPGQHKTLYFYYGGPSGPGNAPAAPVRPDLIDRLRRVIDPLGHSTWYEYNGRGQVTKVTHEDGTFTQSKYNDDGTLAWTADENHANAWMDGHEHERTRYEYDEYKRVTKVTNPLNQSVTNSYAPWTGHGRLSHTTSSVYRTTSHLGKKTDYDYDANFRRERVTVAPGTEDEATTTSTYDAAGNLKTVRDPKGQATGRETIYEYDDRNRRTSVTNPLGQTTAWLYDDAGNMTRETRADTKFRTWDEYDAMNRIKRTTGFLNEPTSFTYDLAGNLRTMTDANGRIYQTSYDELNRKKHFTYPTDATNQVRWESWRYDIAGNLKWYKNPAHQFKHFQYDERNRPRRSYWDGSDTDTAPANWSIGPETTTTPDAASRVLEIRTNGGETIVAYGYDTANRKIWEDQTVAGFTRRVETNPDADGNRGTLSVPGVPDAYSFTYQYTQRQQLREINRGGGLKVDFTHDVNGNLTKRQHMAQGQGHDATRFQYDDANRVTLCEQTGHNNVLFARSNYNDYDLVNNLKSISREEDGDQGERFEYDDANQLKKVSYKADVEPGAPEPGADPAAVAAVGKDAEREAIAALEADPGREPLAGASAGGPEPDAASTGPRTVTYTNDAINRLSMNDNGTVTNYSPNHLNQYTAVTGQAAPGYDEKFNLSAYDGWTYVYDAEKRLVSASKPGHSAQFVYDGLGRCVKRTIDTVATVFTYDGWKPIVEWTGAGAFVAWNLYGPGADEILVRYQPNTGGHVHYHLDALGNVQFLLSGELHLGLEKYTYDAFGKATITGWYGAVRAVSQYGNRFLFTGREYLYTLGIYDYRHRIYHPELGRFMQVDPIGFKGDAMNLYRYCGGNPVNRSDPSGLAAGLVTVDDQNNVNIDLPMHYSAPVAQTMPPNSGQTLNAGINTTVRGDYGKFHVRTNAYESWFGNRITYYAGQGGPSKTETGGNTGTWYEKMFPGVTPGYIAAHEAMHLLGLPDLYIGAPGLFKPGPDRKPQPQHGVSPNNLMVGRGGTELTQDQIQQVVNINAKPRTAETRLMKSVVEAMRSSGLPAGNPGAYYNGSIYASGSQAAGVLSWDRMYGTFAGVTNRTLGF